jgi:hypothetical protein
MTERGAGDTGSDGDLYVITLCTASLPMVLRVPFVHELSGFSVFRSRTVEDGRERFRLFVGYFDSASRAHEALTVVRRHYPAAWISCAPRENLGSLDDTMNTAFRLIRRATARVTERPSSPPALTDVVSPGELPVRATSPATLANAPATQETAPAPAAAGPQRYVVQLAWSPTVVPSTAIPQLALLRAYNLYRAQLMREDGVHHALRLGFFKNVHSARQVAEYVRVHFPDVTVVPISPREYARAMKLLEERTHARPAAPAPRTVVWPLAQVEASTATPANPAAPFPPAKHVEDTARILPPERSRAELLALLGADQLEMDGPANEQSGITASDPTRARNERGIRSW